MAEITLQVPDELAESLAPFRNRLPELLERGLYEVLHELERYLTIEHLGRFAKGYAYGQLQKSA